MSISQDTYKIGQAVKVDIFNVIMVSQNILIIGNMRTRTRNKNYNNIKEIGVFTRKINN